MHLEGVYQRSSFNEHGDISYDRPYNQMAMLYDPNMKIEINSKIISDDFFDYLNNFANYCTKKKASIYYSFSPLNELAISNSKIDNFFETLFQKLDFEIISRLEDYIFDAGYFYDSNFHLNNAGSILRTRQLIIDLKRTLGDSSETDIEIPEIPTVPSNSEGEDSKTAHMFEYKSINGGLELSSLKEEYKDEISLELPSFAEGQKVLSVGKEAFSTSLAVTSITVPHGYSLFMSGAFSNCPTLKKVYLKSSDPSSIQVGLSGFLDGASKDIKFIVPYDSYGAYVTNYFWGNYSEYIDTEEGFLNKGKEHKQ